MATFPSQYNIMAFSISCRRFPLIILLMIVLSFSLSACSSSPSGPDTETPDEEPVQGVTIRGIDLSHHNIDNYAPIDWTAVLGADYRFAFIKATDGYNSCWRDPTFQQNMDGGYQAGVLMGAYHYARPDLNADARGEARCFLNTVENYLTSGWLRPVLDLETGASLGKERLSNWVHVWMNAVEEQSGIEPILYTYSSFTFNFDSSITSYDFWLAHYTGDPDIAPNPGLWDDWEFWQYTDEGSVTGVTDPTIDLDIFNGGLTRLQEEFVIP